MNAATVRRGRLYGLAKAAYHGTAARIDVMTHPIRHRRVVSRIRRQAAPKRILVVCHGNVCRSPYLAALLQRGLPNVEVSSAGFLRGERPVPEHSLTASTRRGLDLSKFRSTTLRPSVLADAELIITMDAQQSARLIEEMGVPPTRIVVAGDLDPEQSERRTIRDPWQQSLEDFERCFDRLDRCAKTLVELVARR